MIRCNYVAALAAAAALWASSAIAQAQPAGSSVTPAQMSDQVAASPTDAIAANPAAADPFLSRLRAGDSAFLARDFEAAAAAYREAIKERPRDALGHYRLGEVLRAQSKFEEALEALGNGLRFASNLLLQARINFVLGDTSERANQLPNAKREWESYLKLAQEHATQLAKATPGYSADDPIYAESASERLKQVNAAIQRQQDYAAVKERIRRREAELDAKARGNESADAKGDSKK